MAFPTVVPVGVLGHKGTRAAFSQTLLVRVTFSLLSTLYRVSAASLTFFFLCAFFFGVE